MNKLVLATMSILLGVSANAACPNFSGNFQAIGNGSQQTFVLNYKQNKCESIVKTSTESNDTATVGVGLGAIQLNGTIQSFPNSARLEVNGEKVAANQTISSFFDAKKRLVTVFRMLTVYGAQEFRGRAVETLTPTGLKIETTIDGTDGVSVIELQRIK